MAKSKKTTARVFRFTLSDVSDVLGIKPNSLRMYLTRHNLTRAFRRYSLGELVKFIQEYPSS